MTTYIGIDWSERKHDIVVLNEEGARTGQLIIEHSHRGFQRLTELCSQLQVAPGACYVGLETSHNLLVDYLWSYGYRQIHVIPPSIVNSSRSRYGNSRARTDQSDAYVLADLLRTDRHRLQLWQPDLLITRQMRVIVTTVHQVTRQIRRYANQLRAVVLRYYPGLFELFDNVAALTTLAFIQRYPTPASAAQIGEAEFREFLREQRYPRPRHLVGRLFRIRMPSLYTEPETAEIYSHPAVMLASLLTQAVRSKYSLQKELSRLFEQHPDAPIFASLPGAGAFLAPALLVKFGDDRSRFATANSVQALAGTCPVTVQSGKRYSVYFRRACDHEFREFAYEWALASVRSTQSPFAIAYYEGLRERGLRKNHAYRCLSNRWLGVAWKLWQQRVCYDEAYHLRQRHLRSQPKGSMSP